MKRGLVRVALLVLSAPLAIFAAGQSTSVPAKDPQPLSQAGTLLTLSTNEAKLQIADAPGKAPRTMTFLINENTKSGKVATGETVIVTYIQERGKLVAIVMKAIGVEAPEGAATPYGTASVNSQRGIVQASPPTLAAPPKAALALEWPNLSILGAEAAEQSWRDADARFKELKAASKSPCDPEVRHALENAQTALVGRTRAWTTYYSRLAQIAQAANKGKTIGKFMAKEDSRTIKEGIMRLSRSVEELKEKQMGMEAEVNSIENSGKANEKESEALKDLGARIILVEQSISTEERVLALDREIDGELHRIHTNQSGASSNNPGGASTSLSGTSKDPVRTAESLAQRNVSEGNYYSFGYHLTDTEISQGCPASEPQAPSPSKP